MMKIKYLLALVIALVTLSGAAFSQPSDLRLPNPGDRFEKLVLIEKEKVDLGFGFKTDVWLTDQADTQADRLKGIIINPVQVKKLIDKSNYKDTAIILRLILGHEKAHCNQFLYYPKSLLDGFNNELRKVIECQADILAGKYLYESFIESQLQEMRTGNYTDKMRKAGSAGLDLFFDLGESNYALAVIHPAKEQRRTAFKIGRIYGTMNQQIMHLRTNWDSIDQGSRAAFDQNIKNLANNLAIVGAETIIDWSFRTAKRITHYSTSDIGNLVFTLFKFELKTDPSASYFEYEYEVANKGDYDLLTDFDVRVERVLRTDPTNSLFSNIFTAGQYSYRLAPGQSARFNGRLKTNYAVAPGEENKYMPVPVFPGQPGASVFVERYGIAPVEDKTDKEFGLSGNEYKAEKNLPIMLEKIMADASNNFRNLVVGPGLQDATAPGPLGRVTTYTCFSPYSEINLIDSGIPGRKPSVTYFIGAYESFTEGKVVFDRTVSNIEYSYRKELDSGNMSIYTQGAAMESTFKSYRFTDLNKTYFFVNLLKDKTTNKFKVNVNILR